VKHNPKAMQISVDETNLYAQQYLIAKLPKLGTKHELNSKPIRVIPQFLPGQLLEHCPAF
jgi:hypothetical protein